jgi:hypothetical protein
VGRFICANLAGSLLTQTTNSRNSKPNETTSSPNYINWIGDVLARPVGIVT